VSPRAAAVAAVSARVAVGVAVAVAVVVGVVGAARAGAGLLAVFVAAVVASAAAAWAARWAGRADAAVREDRYRTILEAAGQVVFEVDEQGRWAYVGPSFSDVLGVRTVPRVGEPCRDSLPADAIPLLTEAWISLRDAGGGVVSGDVRYLDDDGRKRVVEWFAVAQRGRRGNGVVGTVRDVTRERRQQEITAALERREQTVIDALPDGVLLYDSEGVVVRANPRARELAGREQVGVQAHGPYPHPMVDVHGDPIPFEEAPVLRVLRTGEPIEDMVLGVDRPDGRVWRRITALPLPPGPDGMGGVVVINRDITNAMEHLEDLARARGEAERANQAKTEFLSRLHHEIRTPLNAVYTAAQLLDERELPEAERRIAARILKGCRLVIGLMEDLREISLIEDGQVRLRHDAVDVADVVATALASVEHMAASTRLRVEVEPIDPALRVWADGKRLTQVLVNLLSNAVKYNRPEGLVRVRVEADGTRLRIHVADTGRGIAAEHAERVFEPFERLDAARTGVEGTGLGLSISRRLVETMDGTLSLASEVGVGSTFTVDLAQAPSVPALHVAGDGDRSAPPALAGAATVLYIEDNPENVELMHDVFQRWPDVVVEVAMTGTEGLARAEALHPKLILLDLHLPDLHGLEVLDGLRQRPSTADIPVIMVTADATGWEQEVPAAQRPQAIVTKPLDVKAFTRVLSGWLEPSRA